MLFLNFQENIQALQARDAAAKHRDIIEEDIERNALIVEGLNPDEVLTRRKRLRQFEREKEYCLIFQFLSLSSSFLRSVRQLLVHY